MSTPRRLAAILAVDVVGYSRLVSADEAGALARLGALRQDIIEPNITRHSSVQGDGRRIFGGVCQRRAGRKSGRDAGIIKLTRMTSNVIRCAISDVDLCTDLDSSPRRYMKISAGIVRGSRQTDK
jgi:class 3 adenylate cyclase